MIVEHSVDANTGEITTVDVDLDTGIAVTAIDGVAVETGPYDSGQLEAERTADREQKQLDRLQGKFDQLKASTLPDSTRLTVADYRQNLGPADLREMATLVNDLRADVIDLRSMVLDLTRIVRGMAAE